MFWPKTSFSASQFNEVFQEHASLPAPKRGNQKCLPSIRKNSRPQDVVPGVFVAAYMCNSINIVKIEDFVD